MSRGDAQYPTPPSSEMAPASGAWQSSPPGAGERALLIGLGLLAVLVPLVPFRYLQLPTGVPGAAGLAAATSMAATLIRYLPAVLCVVLGAWWAVWLWRGARRAEGARGAHAGAHAGAQDLGISHAPGISVASWRDGLGRAPLIWPVIGLLLAGLLSSVGARQPVLSVLKSVYYFATGGLLYLMVVSALRDVRSARVLLWCLLGAGYVVALYGILEFAAGANPLFAGSFDAGNQAYRRLVPDPWWEGRITATVGHPVALGAYLVLLLPVSLAATTAASSRRGRAVLAAGTAAPNGRARAVLAVGTALLGAAVLLTFSRGAWLAGAAGIMAFVVLRGVRRGLLVPLLLAVAVVTAALAGSAAFRDKAVERVTAAYEDYVLDFGGTTRGAGYGYVATIAAAHPLSGLGTGMYRFAAYDLRRTLDIPTPVGVLDTPDNMYLMWLAENGAIGLVVGVYVLLGLALVFWRASRDAGFGGAADGQSNAGGRQSSAADTGVHDEGAAGATQRQQRVLAAGFLAALVALAVDMLTVDALYFPVLRTVFWILAGVGVVLARSTAEKAAVDPGTAR